MSDRINVKTTQQVCPFCKSGVESGIEQKVCSQCLTRHHNECWDENASSCGVFGCDSKTYLVPPEHGTKLPAVAPHANVAPSLFTRDRDPRPHAPDRNPASQVITELSQAQILALLFVALLLALFMVLFLL